jgi:hypothetical protein
MCVVSVCAAGNVAHAYGLWLKVEKVEMFWQGELDKYLGVLVVTIIP